MRDRFVRVSSIICEAVEARRHLTAATVMGSSSADEIRMTVSGSTIIVDVNGFAQSYPSVVYNSVSIQASGGADKIYIDSNDGVPVTVNAGNGDDEIHLAEASQNLDDVATGVTVTASSGNDVIILHDDAATFADTYTVNNSKVTRSFFGGVTHNGISAIKLSTGDGADTFNVINTSGANLILDGQGGADILKLNSATGGLAEVRFENDQDFASVDSQPGGNLTLAGSAGLMLTTNQSNFEGNVTIGTGFIIERNSEIAGGLGYWRGRLINRGTATTPSLGSSAAEASATNDAIGYAYAEDLAFNSLHGFGLSSGDLVLRYTLKGDTNLDQVVNFADLLSLAQNYGVAGFREWRQGDFTLSRSVAFDDLLALAQNYGATTPSLVAAKKPSASRVSTSVIA